MFTIAKLLGIFTNKVMPNRKGKYVTALILMYFIDMLLLVLLMYSVASFDDEALKNMNSTFEKILMTLILSVILSQSLNGNLFSESKKKSEENKISVKLLLIVTPLILVFIPTFNIIGNYYKIQLFTYYIFFVLLIKVIFKIIEITYKKNINNKV